MLIQGHEEESGWTAPWGRVQRSGASDKQLRLYVLSPLLLPSCTPMFEAYGMNKGADCLSHSLLAV